MANSKIIFDQIKDLLTEQRNPLTQNIDKCTISDILTIINTEDKKVALAVENQILYISSAVELVINALSSGGRLIYIGAGTSGRLGILDAVESPPTFGTDPKIILGLIAGGKNAMFSAQEGAEDLEENGARDIDKVRITKKDVVCGIAASLRTPYVVGAIKRANKRGAKTIYITTNPRSKFLESEFKELSKAIDVVISPEVGPEVIMGSTRMKSGTAQKLILNMISTTAMIRLGKVYENMMIDLQMTNQKLRERAKRIIMAIANVPYEEAELNLRKSGYHVKTAIVMIKAGVTRKDAQILLRESNGFVRAAIDKGIKK